MSGLSLAAIGQDFHFASRQRTKVTTYLTICLMIGNPLLSGGAASTNGSGYSQNAENQIYGSLTMTVLAVGAFILILASIFAVAAYLDYHHLRSLRSTTGSRNSQDDFPPPAEDGMRTLDSREYSRRATPASTWTSGVAVRTCDSAQATQSLRFCNPISKSARTRNSILLRPPATVHHPVPDLPMWP